MPENEYKKELKRNAPYTAFGVGAGAGMLSTQSGKVGKFLKKRKLGRLNKLRTSRFGAAAVPIAAGSAAYIAANKATGKKMDTATSAMLLSLGGGASSVALHDKLLRSGKKFNPLVRNSVGSAGAIIGGMGAVAYKMHMAKKKKLADAKKKALQK